MYDYFYGEESEQFSFYRIPKVLFTDERFKSVSAEVKILYGLLLDRMSLSMRNGWLDNSGKVYIIFTIEDIMDAMGCADQKAGKLLVELEKKCGLIERKRQGLGKPNLIYVKNFVDLSESRINNRENHDSAEVNFTSQESLKSRCNNTEYNKTDFSDTDSLLFDSKDYVHESPTEAKRCEAISREQYREVVKANIDYDTLKSDSFYNSDALDEILDLIVDVVCTTKSTIRISGDDKPTEVVRSQLLKLDSEHIKFVLDSLRQNTTQIRNIRQYLLATLYNAPLTIGNYFRSRVSHDLSEDFKP